MQAMPLITPRFKYPRFALSGSHLLAICFSLIACASVLAAAPKKPRGNRFLFVVETTSAMLPFEHAGRQATFDLVFSGVGNQMEPGDTIGLWNFGQEVHGGVFPMQVWDPEQNLQLASSMGVFLKNQKYESAVGAAKLVPQLLSLIKSIQDVNIFIISSTQHTWTGTPCDAELNAAFQKKVSESLATKRPLITTFVARKGLIASWSVTVAGEAITLPKISVPEPAPALAKTPSAPVLPKNALVKSIVIASERAAANLDSEPGAVRIVVSNRPSATLAQNEPPLPGADTATQASSLINETAKSNGETNVAPAGPRNERQASTLAAKTSAPASATESDPIVKPANPIDGASRFLPGPLVVAARERAETNSSNPSAAPSLALASPPQPFLTARTMFILGAASMAISLVLLTAALRVFRQASKPSYITRSLERGSS